MWAFVRHYRSNPTSYVTFPPIAPVYISTGYSPAKATHLTEVSRRLFVRSAIGLATTLQLQRAASAFGFGETPDVCTLEAEQEVGPYYVANEMIRRDIRENKAGFPLALDLLVLDSRTCQPLRNAAIDVWHCDALGLYAGYTKNNPMEGPGGPGGPSGPPPGDHSPEHGPGGPPPFGMHGPPPTDKLTFLRGIQFTDAAGRVTFQTVFPGFYQGRTNHIHFKVRLGGQTGEARGHQTYVAGHTSHIGQVFFPEDVSADLMKHEPYASHKIHRTTTTEDGVFNGQHGDTQISTLKFLEPGRPQSGMNAHLVAAVDPTATPAPVRGGFGPPPR